MSAGKVDVLAVMDRHIEAADGQLPFGRDSFEALTATRAAVAELIAASEEYWVASLAFAQDCQPENWARYDTAERRWQFALAAVQP